MGAPQYEQAGADIGGTGTTNTIPRWTGASTLGNSGLIDDGTQVYTTARNVGIGTASPAGKLDIADAASASVYISRPGLSAVYGAAGLGNLRWRDTANAFDAAQISAVGYFPGSNGQMTFSTAAGGTMIERMRIATNASQAASQVAIGTSSFTSGCSLTVAQSIDVSQSAQGLKLQGTAGTNNTDPNVLDFYADGGTANSGGVTWTPELRFGGATTGITYASRVGRYTRVGNMIFATCYIALTSKGSATGAATIAGLPTSSNTSGLFSSGSIGYNVGVTYTNMLLVRMNANASAVTLTSSSAAGALANTLDTDFTNTSELVFSIAYPVT